MINNIKFLTLVILSIACSYRCVLGHPRTRLIVYNNRSEIILVIQDRVKMGDSDPVKFTTEIKAKSSKPISGRIGLFKPISKVYEYVIIKDNHDNELMNLRGETLNNSVTIEIDNENHVIYRLDVN